ncbi:MAG: ABC transporter permease [candidate division Zixibacteria bacterium]|nr:ABC transporter permease [candidate division Zixibacteria bacterium]
MRKILWLARREYLAAVRTTGFIIALVAIPIVMSGSVIAMLLLKDRVDTTDRTIVVIDRSGVVADELIRMAQERNEAEIIDSISGKKVKPAYEFTIIAPDTIDPDQQRLELSDRIRAGEIHAFLEIGPDVLHPRGDSTEHTIAYHAEGAAIDGIPSWMNSPVNRHLRATRMIKAGMDSNTVDDALIWLNIERMNPVQVDEAGAIVEAKKASRGIAVGIPIGMTMLTLVMIAIGAAPMLSSVIEEKTQKIAEVLLGSMTPFQFMMGKILGGMAVSLTTSAVYVLGGVVFALNSGFVQYIPFHVLPWFFAFFTLGIIMFGSMFGAIGSLCNDPKDAQALTFPAMLPLMMTMFVLGPVIKQPLSGFATWMSLMPPFAPTLMMLRMATPAGVPGWQPWVAITGVIICTFLAVWIGGRVFRIGILLQGKPPRLADIARWIFKG